MQALLDFSLVWLWCVPLAVMLSLLMMRRNMADTPNVRSSHVRPTPKGGGVAFVVPCAIFCGVTFAEPLIFIALIPAFVIAIMGYWDDVSDLPWQWRLGIQLVMAIVPPTALLIQAHMDGNSLSQWSIMGQVIFFCVSYGGLIAMTNITNFMDGIDGIAGLQGFWVAVFLTWVGLVAGQILVIGMAYYLVMGLIGFLVFNIPKARLFMGDVGSQFLGFLLGTLGIIIAAADVNFAYAVPLLMTNFLFDGGLTIMRRLMRRENIFHAHRSHLYQCMTVPGGWSHAHMSALSSGFVVFQGALVLANTMVLGLQGWATLWLFAPAVVVQIGYAYWVLQCRVATKG